MKIIDVADQLLGTTIAHKDDDKIKRQDYVKIEQEFGKINHGWAKACYLYKKTVSKDKSVKYSAKKIFRELQFKERQFFDGVFHHFYSEIERAGFAGRQSYFDGKLRELFFEKGGEKDFVIVARAIYQNGESWVLNMRGVVVSPEMKKQIMTLK